LEVRAYCPAHPERLGKEDRSASFYFNQMKLVGHCFSCDFKTPTLDVLVEYLTGAPAEGDVVLEARKRSLAAEVDRISVRKERELADSVRYMEWTLSEQFRPVPERLLEIRRILRAAADFFQVRFDREHRCWVLPIRSPRGALWGWQQKQNGGVYNWPKEVKKSDTLFGFHLCESDRVALVESPLDVVRLHQAGVPAVASFGAGVSNRQVELLARNFGCVVLALDNDSAGLEAMPRLERQLKKRTGVVRWDYSGLAKGKDPGDYSSDEELTTAWKRTLRLGL
jgi:DNA primase